MVRKRSKPAPIDSPRSLNDMRKEDLVLFGGIALVALLATFWLNPIHKKNITKLKSNKPTDRQKITIDNIVGTIESIHPWGRTEVVPIKGIELEYFEFCDQWVMYGDVVQPVGRKGYFMPVMRGRLNLDVKDFTETWIEYGGYETGFKIAGDFEFIARIFSTRKISSFYFKKILIHMRSGGVSTSFNLKSKILLNREILLACRKNGVKTNLIRILYRYFFKISEYFRL